MSGSAVRLLMVLAVAAGCLAWPLRCPEAGPERSHRRARGDGQSHGGKDGLRSEGAGDDGRGRLRARAQAAMQADLADLVALIAAPLGAGVPPQAALAAAVAASRPASSGLERILRDLERAAHDGDAVGPVWLTHAREQANPDLELIGRSWLLTERTGASLVEALAVAESVLRARMRARARLDSVVAGPRASMVVLVALPLSAPLVGFAFGLTPAQLYLSSPVACASAGSGAVLAGVGWWWGRRILAGALESSRRDGPWSGRRR